ncbi:MAG: MoaD/ThiS family protein [Crocinitomicaceae bacterium]
MEIKYFGKIAEVIGHMSEQIVLDNLTVSELKKELFEKYVFLKTETIQVAVNLNIVEDDFVINQNDEVAILPPFSGG